MRDVGGKVKEWGGSKHCRHRGGRPLFHMATLLHEYWESDDGGEFGPVRERCDQMRPLFFPHAKLVFQIEAASWFEAKRLYNERLDFGPFDPPNGVDDIVYTDDDAREQQAYLIRRALK